MSDTWDAISTTSDTHPVSTGRELPQELIDMIIDFLHDDKTTLSTCCLVSRYWVVSSRLHFFRKIVLRYTSYISKYRMDGIDPPSMAEYLASFSECTFDGPGDTATIIETIHIHGAGPAGRYNANILPLPLQTLEHILQRLPHLQELRLFNTEFEQQLPRSTIPSYHLEILHVTISAGLMSYDNLLNVVSLAPYLQELRLNIPAGTKRIDDLHEQLRRHVNQPSFWRTLTKLSFVLQRSLSAYQEIHLIELVRMLFSNIVRCRENQPLVELDVVPGFNLESHPYLRLLNQLLDVFHPIVQTLSLTQHPALTSLDMPLRLARCMRLKTLRINDAKEFGNFPTKYLIDLLSHGQRRESPLDLVIDLSQHTKQTAIPSLLEQLGRFIPVGLASVRLMRTGCRLSVEERAWVVAEMEGTILQSSGTLQL